MILAVGIYGATSFIFQSAQIISLFFLNSKYNNIIGNAYFPFEVITLLSIYFVVFTKQALRYSVVALGATLILFYFFKISDQFSSLKTNTETIRDIIMILCSLGYFFYLIHELPKENVTIIPMFWINTSMLVYFSCTFLLSLSLDYLTGILKDDLTGYWTFRNFLRVAFCATICFGLWRGRKEIA
ncbi:MAG: hypothetical protein EBR30_23975 [Cytophagia bacterium]|nr:hypothetical protein [Cytophagia bacterium]